MPDPAVDPDQQPVTLTPGTPEYDAAMVAKANAAAVQGEPSPDDIAAAAAAAAQPEARPEWLPEKFKSPEDLAKSYAELEKKLSAPAAKPDDGEGEGAKPKEGEDDPAEKAAESAGLNLSDISAHYDAEGSISEEHYTSLAAAGIDRATVDNYVAGLEAQAQLANAPIYAAAGGEEDYNAMVDWAQGVLSVSEATEFNKALAADPAEATAAVSSLKTRWELERTVAPQTTLKGNPTANDSSVFESQKDITIAMADPRYKSSPAYRAEVHAKLARSS